MTLIYERSNVPCLKGPPLPTTEQAERVANLTTTPPHSPPPDKGGIFTPSFGQLGPARPSIPPPGDGHATASVTL